MEMRMEMRLSNQYLQLQTQVYEDDKALEVYEDYRDRRPLRLVVPTLHGPRLANYHVLPHALLKKGWLGERFAGGIEDRIFISSLVPALYRRYGIAFVYHLHSDWCIGTRKRKGCLTAGPPYYRAMEIELGLAKAELPLERFDAYWEFRKVACTTGFFKRRRRLLDDALTRIDKIADLFGTAGVNRLRLWKL